MVQPARPRRTPETASGASRRAGSAPRSARPARRREAWIGLGANLGETRATLAAALAAIAALPRTRLIGQSSLYRTAPIGAGGPDYLNAVARIDTGLDPHELLSQLLAIERSHGRARPHPNAPRTLDLDLLMVDDLRVESAALTVPHPRMHARAFVLAPLAELAPALSIPGRGRVDALLADVATQAVERLGDRDWHRAPRPAPDAARTRDEDRRPARRTARPMNETTR